MGLKEECEETIVEATKMEKEINEKNLQLKIGLSEIFVVVLKAFSKNKNEDKDVKLLYKSAQDIDSRLNLLLNISSKFFNLAERIKTYDVSCEEKAEENFENILSDYADMAVLSDSLKYELRVDEQQINELKPLKEKVEEAIKEDNSQPNN